MLIQNRKYAAYCALTIFLGAAVGIIAFFASERTHTNDALVSFDLGCIREHGTILGCEVAEPGHSLHHFLSRAAAKFQAQPLTVKSGRQQLLRGDSSMKTPGRTAIRLGKTYATSVGKTWPLDGKRASDPKMLGKAGTADVFTPLSVDLMGVGKPRFLTRDMFENARKISSPGIDAEEALQKAYNHEIDGLPLDERIALLEQRIAHARDVNVHESSPILKRATSLLNLLRPNEQAEVQQDAPKPSLRPHQSTIDSIVEVAPQSEPHQSKFDAIFGGGYHVDVGDVDEHPW